MLLYSRFNYYFYTELSHRYQGTLQINELRVEDRGPYYCRVKNTAGYDEAITELTIVTKPVVEEFINVTYVLVSILPKYIFKIKTLSIN